MAEQLRFDIFATDQASPAFTDVASSAELAAAGAARLKEELDTLAATTAASTGATLSLANADRLLVAVEDELSGKTAAAAAAQVADAAAKKDNAAATARLTAAAGAGVVVWGLTAAQLHWVVSGAAELLAVTVPAAVALTGFGAAGAKAAQDIAHQMQTLNTATSATNAMLGQTTSGVLGLGGSFAALQDKVKPQVLQLFGAGLNAASGGVSKFGGTVTATGALLDRFAAKVDVGLRGAFGTTLTGLMSAAVPDLQQIGQVFGNLGQAVLNLASKMPGLATVLLKGLDAVTGLILDVSKLPTPVIFAALAFEEFVRWGGAAATTATGLATGLSRIALSAGGVTAASSAVAALGGGASRLDKVKGAVSDLGTGLSAIPGRMAALATNPWTWAIAGTVALAALAVVTLREKDATDQLIVSMRQQATAAPNTQVLNVLIAGYAELAAAHTAAVKAVNTPMQGLDMGGAAQAVHDMKALSVQMTENIATQANVVGGAAAISLMYGVTMPQALVIADQAGVKLASGFTDQSKDAKDARQQVANYVAGMKAMAGQAGVLGADMDALNISAGIQSSNVGKLNTAWDQTVALSSGLQSGFIKVQQGLDAINSSTSTGSISVGTLHERLTQLQDAAKALSGPGSLTQAGLVVRSAFQAAVVQVNSFFDQLRNGAAAGVISNTDFTKSVASTIAEMLPYAKSSELVTAQLAGLAYQAGGPLTSDYKTLKTWVDKNALSTGAFNKLLSNETVALADVSAVALQFAAVMQTKFIDAITEGQVAFNTITADEEAYMTALARHGKDSRPALDAQKVLNQAIIDGGVAAHLTQGQIADMIVQADQIPKKEAMKIVVAAEGAWSVDQAANAAGIRNKFAAMLREGFSGGGPIGGSGGPTADDHLIRASTGEYVVQAGAVSHYGQSMLEAINAKRFAYGGPVTGLPAWWGGEKANLNATVTAATQSAMLNALAAAVAAADNSALAASSASLGGSFSGPAQQAARQMLAAMGWSSQWPAFNALVMAESGWNVRATNPSSGAYGIPQALPPGKMASAGADWMTNAITQLRWMMGYIRGRWGDPNGAWANEQAAHWYGSGGVINEPVRGIGLRSGLGYMFGEHGTPETVTPGIASAPQGVTRDQIERLITAVRAVAPGVGDALNGVARTAAHAGRYATR